LSYGDEMAMVAPRLVRKKRGGAAGQASKDTARGSSVYDRETAAAAWIS